MSDDRATAFLLAAGHGSRLRPITADVPKPLVPVCGLPMIAYALGALRRAGHRRVVVNAWHLADQIVPWQGLHDGLEIEVVVETGASPLGTGGGLRNARDRLADRVTVVNGDILCDADLAPLSQAVPPGGAALLLRRHADDAARYGLVSVDEAGRVVQLRDRTASAQGTPSDDTHFTGLHALDRSVLERLADGPACIVGEAYLDLVGAGLLHGVVTDRPWIDVGNPAALLTANLAVLCTPMPVPTDPFAHAGYAVGPRGSVGSCPSHVTISGPVWIHSDARVGMGCTLGSTVVGAHAVLPPRTRLDRCVVFDGVTVPAGTWHDTLFPPSGPVPLGS